MESQDDFDIDAHIRRRIDEELDNDDFDDAIDDQTSDSDHGFNVNDASCLQIPCLTPGQLIFVLLSTLTYIIIDLKNNR